MMDALTDRRGVSDTGQALVPAGSIDKMRLLESGNVLGSARDGLGNTVPVRRGTAPEIGTVLR